MNKSLIIAVLLTAIGLLSIGGQLSQAQMVVGNFRQIATTDKTVVAAANFAVQTRRETVKDVSLELTAIESAERQVVAGSNYRLCLSLQSNRKSQQATATVYLNLQNEFSLSSWSADKCTGSDTHRKPQSDGSEQSTTLESVGYKGSLESGKIKSLILYLGEESGDYAAFCFTNKSKVGRAVLAACKTGGQCEFTGKVDFSRSCQVKNLAANLSASGQIISIESVKPLTRSSKTAPKNSAPAKTALAPDIIVKKLYAAQKAGSGPFFQKENRAAVDKYFAKDFADLIWKDAISATDGMGALDADPLYHAQDTGITAFLIGRPEYDNNSGTATVLVSFKNFGQPETVKFLFVRDAAKTWKITDIVYRNGDMLKSFLKTQG